jgi:molybdate transport system substrate-binding protein
MSYRLALSLLATLVVACSSTTTLTAQRATRVAAASDLNTAMPELTAAFTRETGDRVEVVFGSSGVLTRQILDGAPFEMFLSADEQFVFQLAEAGAARDRGALYAIGHIVLFAPPGSPLVPSEGLAGLKRLLSAGRITRFAIANPAVAPYGRAAEAALRASGLWDDLRPRIVLGENVSQAAQFATTGNVTGGIIAASLASAPNMRNRGTFALIPSTQHPPLRQRMVLLTRSGSVAERFYAFMQSDTARAILAQYGFGTTEESKSEVGSAKSEGDGSGK